MVFVKIHGRNGDCYGIDDGENILIWENDQCSTYPSKIRDFSRQIVNITAREFYKGILSLNKAT